MSPRRNAVRSVKNQYRGINAHLHSLWQAEGGWSAFHTAQLVHLATRLMAQLRPLGYTAKIEPSLQIRRVDDSGSEAIADVAIYDLGDRPRPGSANASAEGVLVMPAPQVLEANPQSEREYSALTVYPAGEDAPVAWLELLSPTNKGNSRDARIYIEKRLDVVQRGVVFVELDYLHESGTMFYNVPSYRIRQGRLAPENAHPYRIAVIDPRPEYRTSSALFYEFDVDQAIPVVPIPLNSEDVLTFDFNAAYQQTWTELYFGDQVDYAQLPANFDRYSQADQARIVRRMLAVVQAAQAGADLEANAPLPLGDVEQLSLEDGLSRLAVLGLTIPSQ